MSAVGVELPQAKREVLEAAIAALEKVPNVAALVLGGSHARGVAEESSDLDIGIYYREAAPLAVDDVRKAAESICAPGSVPVVTELYGWGPWVNGGAWIQTPATKVDFVYRNLDQVWRVIEEGRRGCWRHDYDQQPPFGFRSVVYFGETHYSVPLRDSEGEIRKLKGAVHTYPEALKAAIVRDGLWGAEFSLWSCAGYADKADVYNAAGCLTRAAQYMIHAIFALNEEYFLNDKHVNRILAQFHKVPCDCAARIADVLSSPGRDAAGLRNSLQALKHVWTDIVFLTEGGYQPRFDLQKAATN